jgi:DNA polymerase III delta prime subunit
MDKEQLGKVPFIELFAPKSLEDVVLPNRIREELNGGVYDNLLFYGLPGIGKSQTAKILCKDMNSMYVNASAEGKIDTIRGKLTDFVMNQQLDGTGDDGKALFFDELEGASAQYFSALRGFMDQYKSVRYIGTTNYISKIPDPIKSRFRCINFDFANNTEKKEVRSAYAKRVAKITSEIGMKADLGGLKRLLNLYFPDFRTILQTIQKLYVNELPLTEQSLSQAIYSYKDVYEMVCNINLKPEEVHTKVLGEHYNDVIGILTAMGSDFIQYILQEKPDFIPGIPLIIIEVANYQAQLPMVIDQQLLLKACLYKVNTIIKNCRS